MSIILVEKGFPLTNDNIHLKASTRILCKFDTTSRETMVVKDDIHKTISLGTKWIELHGDDYVIANVVLRLSALAIDRYLNLSYDNGEDKNDWTRYHVMIFDVLAVVDEDLKLLTMVEASEEDIDKFYDFKKSVLLDRASNPDKLGCKDIDERTINLLCSYIEDSIESRRVAIKAYIVDGQEDISFENIN